MSTPRTGFDKWAAEKMKAPKFEKAYVAARRRVDAVDGLVRRLDALREKSGMSKAELARAIDAKPEIIRRLFTKEGANPTLETIVQIAEALGLELQLVPKTEIKKQAVKASGRSKAKPNDVRAEA